MSLAKVRTEKPQSVFQLAKDEVRELVERHFKGCDIDFEEEADEHGEDDHDEFALSEFDVAGLKCTAEKIDAFGQITSLEPYENAEGVTGFHVCTRIGCCYLAPLVLKPYVIGSKKCLVIVPSKERFQQVSLAFLGDPKNDSNGSVFRKMGVGRDEFETRLIPRGTTVCRTQEDVKNRRDWTSADLVIFVLRPRSQDEDTLACVELLRACDSFDFVEMADGDQVKVENRNLIFNEARMQGIGNLDCYALGRRMGTAYEIP